MMPCDTYTHTHKPFIIIIIQFKKIKCNIMFCLLRETTFILSYCRVSNIANGFVDHMIKRVT